MLLRLFCNLYLLFLPYDPAASYNDLAVSNHCDQPDEDVQVISNCVD